MMGPIVVEVHDHMRYGEAVMIRGSDLAGSQTVFRCRYRWLDGTHCQQVWTSDAASVPAGTYTMTVHQVETSQQSEGVTLRGVIQRVLDRHAKHGTLTEADEHELSTALGRLKLLRSE